jgi:hypothetical protein
MNQRTHQAKAKKSTKKKLPTAQRAGKKNHYSFSPKVFIEKCCTGDDNGENRTKRGASNSDTFDNKNRLSDGRVSVWCHRKKTQESKTKNS